MFAGDYDRKGILGAHSFSIVLHLLVFALLLWHSRQESKRLSDYVLTEVNMIQEVPDEKKPMEVQKPKKMFDMLKELVPLIPDRELASINKLDLKAIKPEIDLSKPKLLSMEKSAGTLKPGIRAIDLDAEIGAKKISAPAQSERMLPGEQKQKIQLASAALNLNGKSFAGDALSRSKSPVMAADLSRGRVLAVKEAVVQPTAVIKKSMEPEKEIESPGKQAVLIQGEVAGRKVISSKTPQYPRWALEQGIEASVTLRFYVTQEGVVKKNVIVEKTSGYGELDTLAQEALLMYRFESLQTAGDQSGYAMFRFVLEK